MCRHRTKESGQVILETTAVFISLAILITAGIKLFSGLNVNMLERIDKYRQDRLGAVNGIFTTPPEDFIYQLPSEISITPGGGGRGFVNYNFYDVRLDQASIVLEEQNNIMTPILPYKANQAKMLADQIYYDAQHQRAAPEEYVATVQSLCREGKAQASQAYNNMGRAIALYEDVLNNPIIPGPFDPNPQAHPELYGIDPDTETGQQELNALINSNARSRDTLQQTIDSLRSAQPGLSALLNGQIIPRLDFVEEWIGSVECDEYSCGLSGDHDQAKAKLNQLVSFVGIIAQPILSANITDTIEQSYNLLQAQGTPGRDAVSQAEGLSDNMLASAEVQASLSLQNVAKRLNDYLNYALRYWDNPAREKSKLYYIGLSQVESWTLYEVTNVNRMLVAFAVEEEEEIIDDYYW